MTLKYTRWLRRADVRFIRLKQSNGSWNNSWRSNRRRWRRGDRERHRGWWRRRRRVHNVAAAASVRRGGCERCGGRRKNGRRRRLRSDRHSRSNGGQSRERVPRVRVAAVGGGRGRRCSSGRRARQRVIRMMVARTYPDASCSGGCCGGCRRVQHVRGEVRVGVRPRDCHPLTFVLHPPVLEPNL